MMFRNRQLLQWLRPGVTLSQVVWLIGCYLLVVDYAKLEQAGNSCCNQGR